MKIELDREERYAHHEDDHKYVIDRTYSVTDRWGDDYTIYFREYEHEPTLLYWVEKNDDEDFLIHKSVKLNPRGKVVDMIEHRDMVQECLEVQGFKRYGELCL